MLLVQILPLVIVNYYHRFNTLYVVGSTIQLLKFLQNHCGFNTLYVVGSIKKFNIVNKKKNCFNTLYVVGSMLENPLSTIVFLFQYIICCWFKFSSYWKSRSFNSFNTLYVVGSNTATTFSLSRALKFQYIICCWFNFYFDWLRYT